MLYFDVMNSWLMPNKHRQRHKATDPRRKRCRQRTTTVNCRHRNKQFVSFEFIKDVMFVLYLWPLHDFICFLSFPLSSVNPSCLWLSMLTFSFLINIRNILTTDGTSPPGNKKIKTSSSSNQQESSQYHKYLALQDKINAVDMIWDKFSLQPWVCVPDKTRHPPSRRSLFCRILGNLSFTF